MKILPTKIEYLMTAGNARIYVKRDDLIPFSFGGNKVRIAAEVFREMESRGSDTVVSYGSASSNLNRVIAHMAAGEGKRCVIIVKNEERAGGHPTFNEIMVLDSGAEIIYTSRESVRETVRGTIARLKSKGGRPYYIYGDETGSGGQEVLSRAYGRAFDEIISQEAGSGVHFDEIFVPVGTGATISGLIRSCDDSHVIRGISIARKVPEILALLSEDIKSRILKAAPQPDARIPEAGRAPCAAITDSCLMGGYGRFDRETVSLIKDMMKKYGLPLDPVYTGKAFCGMLKELEAESASKAVLFIHTGGLPLYFDMLETM